MVSMELDIVTYDIDDFNKLKASCVHQHVIISKISKILEPFTCFQEKTNDKFHDIRQKHTNRYHSYHRNSSHHIHNMHNTHNNTIHNNQARKPLKICSGDDKHRQVIGIINKITNVNFDIVSKKLVGFVNENNVVDTINLLFEASFREHMYIDLYIKMIQRLCSQFPFIVQQVIEDFARLYIPSIQSDFDKLTHTMVSDYDNFCNDQKLKIYIIGKLKLTLNILQKFKHQYITYTDIITNLVSLLKYYVENNINHDINACKNLQELVVQMIYEFVAYVPQNEYEYEAIVQFLNSDIADTCSIRCKFKLKDIFDKLLFT